MSARGVCFDLARVTVEFLTPMRVGAGGWDPLHDSFFATDANGLPALPGTSIAGVLRHAAAETWSEDQVRSVFGFQERDDGRASRLEVSWGQVHDQTDRPVPFIGAQAEGDPVLSFLRGGVLRDHVRIDARGAVDGRGKFDELMVPAGARFTFELVLHAGAPRGLDDVLGLLASPTLRVGAGGRNGLGRLRVERAAGRRFDLSVPEQRAAYLRLPRALHEVVPTGVLSPVVLEPADLDRWVSGVLRLSPEDFWMIGRGVAHREEHQRNGGKELDLIPVEEQRVEWSARGGRVAERAPSVPASAIKGALRHRTAFHARKSSGQFFDPTMNAGAPGTDPGAVDAVRALFGEINSDDGGSPGRVLLSDGRATGWKFGRLDHVSLDRFTQGPLDHHLFGEAPLFGGTIEMDVAIDVGRLGTEARKALQAALDDLTTGRLAIGGGSNRGHGYCTGTIEWHNGRGLTP